MNNIKQKVTIPSNEAITEAYNTLRANVQFCTQEKGIKTIAITSYGPGEGKSTTSLNLATSFAQVGKNVLYVDADLRKPLLFKELNNYDFNGLSNYLLEQIALEDAVRSTNINGLYSINCGIKPLNPSELINSNRLVDFIQNVRQEYDLVIIDTPPLGSVIDSAVISALTDATIIVIASDKVRGCNARMMKVQLEKANANIIGVVLNKVNQKDYKYYYGGYNYYGKNKKLNRQWLKKIRKKRRK